MQPEFRMHGHEDTSMITNARNARNARFVHCALNEQTNARNKQISELRKDLPPPTENNLKTQKNCARVHKSKNARACTTP